MIPLGYLVNAAGGVLFLLLGLWLATLRPRRATTSAFAAFCAFFGLAFIGQNLLSPDFSLELNAALALSSGLASFPAAAALVVLALRLPEPLRREERRLLILPALLGGAYALVGPMVLLTQPLPTAVRDLPTALVLPFASIAIGVAVLLGAVWGSAILFALRFRRASPDHRRQYALLGAALAIFPGMLFGSVLMETEVLFLAIGVAGSATGFVASLLWLAAARGAHARAARNVGLLTLGCLLAGMAASSVWGGFAGVDGTGLFGLARGLSIALLAYAILRHQLLGLDVKVRWTIKQSTVAAAFIVVFFVVSEGAQAFFAESGLGPYLGIAAAGMLVFALAPLQRAAERVASAAMPIAGPPPPPSTGKEQAYRAALRFALRDRVITPAEELELAHLADELGLRARRSLELRQEVERELASEVRPPARARRGVP